MNKVLPPSATPAPSDKDEQYRWLEADRIVLTAEQLSRRISERFPNAGLTRVSQRLLEIARQSALRGSRIGQPMLWLRWTTAVVAILVVASSIATIVWVGPKAAEIDLAEFIQVLDAAINEVVIIGAAIVFLVTYETRVKRRRALGALHELRSLAHIIDMHQLTKDPESTRLPRKRTRSSPTRTLTPFELERYLDYCTEMLSLLGKIAVLYVQNFPDTEAVAAVNDIEDLTTGLSRKIWQKIMLIETLAERESGGSPSPGKPVAG